MTVVNKAGGLVVIKMGDDGITLGPPVSIPEDPANRVAWIVQEADCIEPVLGEDFILGIGRFKDGRGREGIRLIRRASGLPYRFEEGDTDTPINKSVYGPNDPGSYLEVDVDIIELDSPEDILDALEAFIKAGEDLGTLLKNPTVTLSAHLARIVLTLIEVVVDDDGVDIGNISPRIYTPKSRIDAEADQERHARLKRSAFFGYDWEYIFTYVLQRVGP